MNDLLHTPEGVRDIVGEECKQKFYLNHRLTRLLSSYGYDPIQTPVFEFSQIFGQEIGTTSDKDLYKFFDREGNTLALRPDFTPSVARASAKYFSTESAPLRLFYRGEVFHNTILQHSGSLFQQQSRLCSRQERRWTVVPWFTHRHSDL